MDRIVITVIGAELRIDRAEVQLLTSECFRREGDQLFTCPLRLGYHAVDAVDEALTVPLAVLGSDLRR